MLFFPWPVVGSLVPAVGGVTLFWYLRRYRGTPGVNWFVLTVAAVVVWCGAYGLSLLVFDPTVRLYFEMLTWTAMLATGIAFLP